jgi:hypothetical protein
MHVKVHLSVLLGIITVRVHGCSRTDDICGVERDFIVCDLEVSDLRQQEFFLSQRTLKAKKQIKNGVYVTAVVRAGRERERERERGAGG